MTWATTSAAAKPLTEYKVGGGQNCTKNATDYCMTSALQPLHYLDDENQ